MEHKHRSHDNYGGSYSSTLGIDTLGLPRRTLTGVQSSSTSFTPTARPFMPPGVSFTPTGVPPVGSCKGNKCGGLEDVGGRMPYSHASVSATLGITSLKSSWKPGCSRRPRIHNQIRQRYSLIGAHHKENRPTIRRYDSCVKSYDKSVRLCDNDPSYGNSMSSLPKSKDWAHQDILAPPPSDTSPPTTLSTITNTCPTRRRLVGQDGAADGADMTEVTTSGSFSGDVGLPRYSSRLSRRSAVLDSDRDTLHR